MSANRDAVLARGARERMLFLAEFEESPNTYAMPVVLRLVAGHLDVDVFTAAFRDVATHHVSLRTAFSQTAEGWTEQVREATDVPVLDLSEQAWDGTLPVAPDPTRDVPSAAAVYSGHVVIVIHHVAADGRSVHTVLDDLEHAYSRRLVGDAPSWTRPASDVDPPHEPAGRLAEAFAELPAVTALPTDRPRQASPSSHAAVAEQRLPEWTARAVAETSGRLGASRLMLLQAAVALALRAHGAGDRVPVGMAADLRGDEEAGVGLFLNTIVAFTELNGALTVGDVISRVRTCALDAWERRAVPFDELVAEVAPPRQPGVHPLFQVMIADVDRRTRRVHLGDVTAELRHDAEPTAKFDLTFAIGEDDRGLVLDVLYRTEIFDPETAAGLLESVVLALVALTGNPSLVVDELALTRSSGGRPALSPRSDEFSSRRVSLPRHHLAAALVSLYVSSDSVGTRRDDDRYVPLELGEILDAADVTDGMRLPDTTRGRPVIAAISGEDVLLRAASDVIDDESWPALLAALSEGVPLGTSDAADYTEALLRRAADLEIIDSAESWLDVLETTTAFVETGRASTPTSDATASADMGGAPASVTWLRGAVVAAVVDVVDAPRRLMVSEPDRDEVAHASAVGHRRRVFPVFVHDDGTIVQPNALAARDYLLAGTLSTHTPGVFDEVAEPDLFVDIHMSDRPVAHRPGHIAVTACIVEDRWQITVSGLPDAQAVADSIAQQRIPDGPPSTITAITRPARAQTDDAARIGAAAIRRIERTAGRLRAVYPATALQEGLLFHRDLSGDTDVYISQTITELTGTLDVAALRAAAARMIERHPHVAGHFRRVGERTVLVVPRSLNIEWEVRRGDDPETFISEQRQRGFDGDGPLLRFGLLTGSDGGQHTWVLTVEHSVLDGWSLWRLLRGILDEYTRPGAVDESEAPPYSAYTSWLAGQDLAAARASWGGALEGIEGPTLVAEPERTGTSPDDRRSVDHTILLEPALTERLRRRGVASRTPLSAVYELAWALAVRYETGADDVVFGTVTSGRPPEIPGIDDLLGLLFNTVPVRVRFRPGGDVQTHLDELTLFRRVMLAHPYVPLSEILATSGHRELFDTLFVFQNIPVSPAGERLGRDGGLSQRGQTVRDATHYPLTVVVNPGDGRAGAKIRVMFRPGAWADENVARRTAERIVAAFRRALDRIADHVGPMATLDVRAGGEDASGPLRGAAILSEDEGLLGSTVWELLVRRARLDPHGLAVVAGPTRWSFEDLVRRSTSLAAALQADGIGPESRVALYLPRDERMIVALFAVFAAHAAYVPIDPTVPGIRVAEILAEASPHVVVVDQSLAGAVPTAYRTLAPDAVVDRPLVEPARHLDSLAYVIFTSGSTGTPKGVAVPYRGLTNMFVNHRAEIFTPVVAAAGGRRLAIAHTTSFAFDASWEQLLWLLEGHSVHVIDDDMRRDPRALLEYYDENRIDGFDVTPSYGQVLVEEGLLTRERCVDPTADGTGVVFVSLGGEAVPDDLWSALRNAPGVGGYNLYGPTEYTINALGADVAERATSTVGRPIAGTAAYVLDRSLQPVRAGVAGELYLSGVGLARGYLGRSDATSERFIADPFGAPGGRMYRTGDIVVVGADGLLSYLGRGDDQVKIRGHRVEPAEVASAITALDGVRRSALVPVRGDRGTELAAYVVAEPANRSVSAPEILGALRSTLPDYLVPRSVTLVDELPLTVNGKLDLRALPTPEREATEKQQPIGDVEYLIAEAISDVLGVGEIGRDEDFFLLGGHSLLAVRVVSRLRSSSGLDLSVRDLYGAPTVAGLARAAAGDHSEGMFAPVLELREGDGPAVFCLQPAGGLGWAYAGLCRHLDPGYAVYALQDPALSGGPERDSVESLVSDQVERIRAIRPTGPYHLLGWSFGGQLAHAIAAQLGEDVASVVLLDSYADGASDEVDAPLDAMVAGFVASLATDPVLADLDDTTRARLTSTFERHLRLSIPPSVGSIPGDALLVAATRGIDSDTAARRDADWRARIAGTLRVEQVDLDHAGLGRAANWEVFGPVVARWIEDSQQVPR
ncbi:MULTISPECIES: non-ribosomal peptide synthetase [unclassified Rathayibacter]|uniref:non-ribosomal peptide synthetase n=1 Tax=unclassified Rathayibacter TaxID=2609250 RepID=UPI00188CF4DA|nr:MULTISPECIES: non-ribosomal peptide synthetase [unclassified Rathayibacter]MBF4462604.1 amino acid adenylation domain-containing protein [Rathayibacter sp. VKM Ac-2879]MBF4503353.1 amino acid adenylation domain-containing protein [Rathayibacter sp. VKM Ac-2878]